MARIQVSMLRGGPSGAYDISLKTGNTALNYLPDEKYDVQDILISRNGEWFKRGLPTTPSKVLHASDVVLNAMHGEYGEDGAVQMTLDAHGIPYTGSGTFSSRLAMNKGRTRDALRGVDGIKMPQYVVLIEDESEDLKAVSQRIFQKFGPSYIVKPLRGGSSVGVHFANSLVELPDALSRAFYESDSVIVEQLINGREVTCGVIEDFRGEDLYVLPTIEIKTESGKNFLEYDDKHSGAYRRECPGAFTQEQKDIISRASQSAHRELGLSQYSRSDFIVSPHGVYYLETNSLPDLSEESLFKTSIDAVGSNMTEFLDHIVTLAMTKK